MNEKRFYLELQKAIEIAESLTLPSPMDVVLKYIEKYYNHGDGEIVTMKVHENACQAANSISYMDYNYVKSGLNKKIDPEHIVIIGKLRTDVKYEDSDPYETAGGYISGVATKGTSCEVFLKYDWTGFGFSVFADVNILEDNYNNNFFGVSTGGGNKSYKMGEKVEHKRIKVFNSIGHSLCDMIEIEAIDCVKIENFIRSQK